MVKYHQKTIAVPPTWPIERRKTKFVIRQFPGGQKAMYSMPLSIFMKDLIKCSHTEKEAKSIVYTKEVLVDSKRKKSLKTSVGLMDVISFPALKEHYRVILDKKGKISAISISEKEKDVKICKIIGKNYIEGKKCQLNLSDGRNLLLDAKMKHEYSVGDSLLIELPKQEIKHHFKFEKGVCVFLIGGKKIGHIGIIDNLNDDTIKVSNAEGSFETAKKYAFVVGKEKPAIKLEEQK